MAGPTAAPAPLQSCAISPGARERREASRRASRRCSRADQVPHPPRESNRWTGSSSEIDSLVAPGPDYARTRERLSSIADRTRHGVVPRHGVADPDDRAVNLTRGFRPAGPAAERRGSAEPCPDDRRAPRLVGGRLQHTDNIHVPGIPGHVSGRLAAIILKFHVGTGFQ